MTDDDILARKPLAARPCLYDIEEQRHRRLARLDARISRCPHHGEWTWDGHCTIPDTAHKEIA